jgi:hypothetical protein
VSVGLLASDQQCKLQHQIRAQRKLTKSVDPFSKKGKCKGAEGPGAIRRLKYNPKDDQAQRSVVYQEHNVRQGSKP